MIGAQHNESTSTIKKNLQWTEMMKKGIQRRQPTGNPRFSEKGANKQLRLLTEWQIHNRILRVVFAFVCAKLIRTMPHTAQRSLSIKTC